MSKNTVITPTIGRIVWYWPSPSDLATHQMAFEMAAGEDAQPMAAQIAYVHSDTMVNLSVTDHLGVLHSRTCVHLAQADDKPIPTNIAFATWMPYQVNQATKEAAQTDKIVGTKGDVLFTDADVESKVLELGLTAPRVTKDDIEAMMARVVYIYVQQPGGSTSTFVHAFLDGKFLLATGHSACVSPENFNPGIGLSIAKGKAEVEARNKLWELEGFALYKRLLDHADAPSKAKAEPVLNTEGPDDYQG